MPERHQSKEPWETIAPPDAFWEGKDPAEWVGREFVGDRQRTIIIRGDSDAVQYRVGLNERSEVVIDRMALDRFFQSAEPAPIDLAAAPENVQAEADVLLAEYVPGTKKVTEDGKSKSGQRSGARPRARGRRAQKIRN